MEENEDELEDNESNNQLINTSQSTFFIVPNSSSTNLNIGLQIDSTDDINEEEIIVKMGAHVEAFRAQRKYTKKKALESKLDLESNITWPDKRYCVCGDYSQNLDLPHFGGEQPGDTYYFSPYSISIFGLVNHANEILSSYTYPEGVGKKGGNNVVSLIYKYLLDNGIIALAETHRPGKEFTIIFDNCAGQNKNRMVIRFGQYLVDKGIFKKVEIIFLITGHTKNICDRRFKDLKCNFHTRNVYTFDSLML